MTSLILPPWYSACCMSAHTTNPEHTYVHMLLAIAYSTVRMFGTYTCVPLYVHYICTYNIIIWVHIIYNMGTHVYHYMYVQYICTYNIIIWALFVPKHCMCIFVWHFPLVVTSRHVLWLLHAGSHVRMHSHTWFIRHWFI